MLQLYSYNHNKGEMCRICKGSESVSEKPTTALTSKCFVRPQNSNQLSQTNPSSGHTKKLNAFVSMVQVMDEEPGHDEPGHDEVRFWWAARHLSHGKLATLVSSRSSGSSYLNKVELQNGCLALGHNNLFIPSTVAGSAFSPETGAVDIDRVRKKLELATSVYIDRVNNCPCGETVIHFY